jgi:hypothetical protein
MTNIKLVLVCVALACGVIAAQEHAKREPMTFACHRAPTLARAYTLQGNTAQARAGYLL